jgi:hypothetical protein
MGVATADDMRLSCRVLRLGMVCPHRCGADRLDAGLHPPSAVIPRRPAERDVWVNLLLDTASFHAAAFGSAAGRIGPMRLMSHNDAATG